MRIALSGALLLWSATALAQEPQPEPEPPPVPPPATPEPPPPLPPPVPAPQPPPPTAPPPLAPPPPPAQPLPSAGGLTAPAPIDPAVEHEPTPTEERLDEAEEEDTERGNTWLWIEAEGGFEHIGLETFDVEASNLTAGFVSTEASGGYVGAGLGPRLWFFAPGVRGRVGFFPDWQLFSIGGELGFRFQVGIVEPHFELGGGYTALGSFSDALGGVAGGVNIDGGYGRVSGGLDFLVASVLNIGIGASWEFFGMTRPGVSLTEINAQPEGQSLDDAQKAALQAEGSGYGSAICVAAKLGLQLF